MTTQSNQPLEGLALHDCSSQRPLDCSLKLADVLAVELCGLVVEGVLGVRFVEQVDKAVDDRVDIQHLPSGEGYMRVALAFETFQKKTWAAAILRL